MFALNLNQVRLNAKAQNKHDAIEQVARLLRDSAILIHGISRACFRCKEHTCFFKHVFYSYFDHNFNDYLMFWHGRHRYFQYLKFQQTFH